MSLKPQITSEAAARTMAEIDPAYTPQQATVEADRCLYCFDAPCIMACPTGIDIPGFIRKIAADNVQGAGQTILDANILGASCARVCPTSVLCEGACVMLDRDEKPIKIGRLQRYATDEYYEHGKLPFTPAPSTGKKIAVLGGGPAGLGCATELTRLGHEAVVFEKKPQAGGLNTYGIAYYKMPPQVSLEEVELIQKLGVRFETGVEVGRDRSMEEIRSEFDAVFIGVGLGRTYQLGIPGEDLPEVVEALDFIETFHINPLHETPVGEHAVVIGCGNTAIDAVTQAKRLGAKSATIIYRRGEADMPAYAYEYDIAKADGCEFLFHAAPVEVLGDDGQVTGLKLIRTAMADGGALQPVEGSEFEVPCDMVIKALGQQKQQALLKGLDQDLAFDEAGCIRVDPETMQTSVPEVYAGGDAINGGREVVNAVADGKKAARGIHAALIGQDVDGPVQSTRLGIPDGKPVGSGFEKPVRVPELEADFYTSGKGA